MQIVANLPPNWEQIKAIFLQAEAQKAVFTWGENLHNPFGAEITRDLEIHEAIHTKQQGTEPQKWWDMYCKDPSFRVQQEAEAYSAQLYYLRNEAKHPSRVIEWYLDKIALTFSGPLYNNALTYPQARTMVRKQLQRWKA